MILYRKEGFYLKLKTFVKSLFVLTMLFGLGFSFALASSNNGDVHETVDSLRGYFMKNNTGQTYGTHIDNGIGEWEEPDLIAVVGEDNIEGYVKKSDLYNDLEMPSTPEEAIEYTKKKEEQGARFIPVYTEDGKTVIGEYMIN